MTERTPLAGRICLVSGAASGLGRAMTLGFLHAGALVAGLDVSEEGLASLAKDAGEAAHRLLPLRCDLRREREIAAAVERTHERFGTIGVLVNCAGLGMPFIRQDYLRHPVRFWEIEPARWRDLVDVNLNGTFYLSHAVGPHLLAAGWGRIINVTTSFNTMMRKANMPYGATKAAIEAASNAWAEELAGTGVTVNVLIPGGAADTAMIPEDAPYDRSKLVRPDAMIAPACWLATRQSDGITGRRFVARKWDPQATWEDNVAQSSSPIAWPDLAEGAAAGQPRSAGALKL